MLLAVRLRPFNTSHSNPEFDSKNVAAVSPVHTASQQIAACRRGVSQAAADNACKYPAYTTNVGILCTHTFTSYYNAVFSRIMVTFLSYVSNSCHSLSGVAVRIQHTASHATALSSPSCYNETFLLW